MVTPLTPHLMQPSHDELIGLLGDAGFPAVGHSSVEIGLTRVLGYAPGSNRFSYREPYPQLPEVDAESTPAADGSVAVTLLARYAKGPAHAIRLVGVYRMLQPAGWQALRQRVLAGT